MNDASTLPPIVPAPSPRLTRRDLLRWISLTAASGAVGCGGGGDDTGMASPEPAPAPVPPPASGPPPVAVDPTDPKTTFSKPGKGVPGTPVTPTQRAEALSALNATLDALYDSTRGIASPAGALAWLEQQAVYQTVGFSATRNVYAVFTDGRALIIGNTRIDAAGVSDGPPRTAAAFDAGNRRRARAAKAAPAAATSQDVTDFEAGIPSRQFRYLNTWATYGRDWPAGVWCRPGVSAMSDISQAGSHMMDLGYQPVGGTSAFDGDAAANTVEALKNVKGDGVFFWTTHGGTLDPEGNIIQGLMTGTEAYQSTVEDTYKDEFAEGTLIYYTGPLCMDPIACTTRSSGTHATRLAITPKFIRKYGWSFGEHSLVFVNACASATGAMKQAFLDAGASVYLGWTQPVRLWAMCGAALDFFSLSLGLNENQSDPRGIEINPFQRPYDWGAVMNHLNARTQAAYYLDDEDGIVELEPTLNAAVPAGFLGLRPSIYWTAFDEARSEMSLIGGVFGTRRGTAAIGASMPCLGGNVACTSYGNNADWRVADATTLAVQDWRSQNVVLKLPADGPGSAGIVQVEVDGRWSNGAQLTRVNFPLNANKNFGGSLSVQVTANLSFRGDFRGVRLDPVQALTYLPMVACSTPLTATGTFVASGVYRYSEGDSGSSVTVEWSGSGVVGPITSGASGVAVTGTVTPQNRTGGFLAKLFGSGIQEKRTVSTPGLPTQVTTRMVGFDIDSQVSDAGAFTIAVPFSARYGAGVTTQNYTVASASPYHDADLTTQIELGPFTAEYPPEERLGGR